MTNRRINPRARMRTLTSLAAVTLMGAALATVPTVQAAETDGDFRPGDAALLRTFEPGHYVVILREPSATRYEGGTGNFKATHDSSGNFDARRGKVRAYEAHLRAEQRQLARSVGAEVDEQFTLASNGFTAELTGRQAERLTGSKQVLLVAEDQAYSIDTWNTPDFLGLSGETGVWNEVGGQDRAGDGVVIGVLDTGVWPESNSFAGDELTSQPQGRWNIVRDGDAITMDKADGGTFRGICQPGVQWAATDCNSKLVGARYYPDTFLRTVAEQDRSPTEVISARDGDGHGTHTASTAGGNGGVDVSVDGTDFGPISGIAPAAKIAAYKVCFSDRNPDTGGCYTSSTLAAVDDAIEDGVDVLNYSISGAQSTVVDAVEYAFEGAAEAGVFIAASAGNSGPGASTVAHNSPWLTTVAASTHTAFENTLVLGNGARIKGASIASQLPAGQKPLVAAQSVKLGSAEPADAARCFPDTLDPAKVAGTIVVCDRGVIARVDKSAEVQRAGGAGMVLANVGQASLDADFHSVPTVHIAHTDTPVVRSYLDGAPGAATAGFERGDTTGGAPTPVPQMAAFSSRGPALANDSDLIKPDITAPGVSVLAAVAPPSYGGRDFSMLSGTSMSSPHVAGLAALMLGARPSWDPMTLKSAMMTTAYDVENAAGVASTDPFAQGAGHVDPASFLDPGLVVTSGARDWRGFLQGQGLDLGVKPLAASDLNGASIAQGQVTASTEISRVFTGLRAGRWQAEVSVPGFEAEHRRSLVITKPGMQQRMNITFTRTTAALGQFATGFLTLTGPTTVRLPIALRPVSLKAPAEVRGQGAQGSVQVPITAGFTGNLVVRPTGLAAAATEQGTLAAGDAHSFTLPVAAGTKLARFDLDAVNDQADLDLYVYRMNAAGTALEALVGSSATGSADESVDLRNPRAASYFIVVEGYSAAPGESTVEYRLDGFRVDGSATEGNLAASPNPVPVVGGVPTSYEAVWSGIDVGTRYLGYLEYEGALAATFIYVN